MLKNPGIGGTEIRPDTQESIAEISPNRTLFAEKLTQFPPLRPEIVKGLSGIAAVFAHYRPAVKVTFKDARGAPVREELRFKGVADFGPSGITAQSAFLQDMATTRALYLQVLKHLHTNKLLRAALEDEEAKRSLLEVVERLEEEL
ncbi:hypothetical protein SAMN05444266_104483 [Chitinophaga jiangningensis]|uniref:Type VI secretion system, VipA, VC_A0107 or Hcp2 n=1 Tax=Chitinophaga jiangningensis TaxID=1419482 RepID=A0A1M7CU91_9BACT|nr:hypothetical protein [Chitinophaga jiangningensis]SHL70898.1 hypothetical protein SAMN05444266_104483 [Chitinophaga jiangningensis]